jgi:hypothetical protein
MILLLNIKEVIEDNPKMETLLKIIKEEKSKYYENSDSSTVKYDNTVV